MMQVLASMCVHLLLCDTGLAPESIVRCCFASSRVKCLLQIPQLEIVLAALQCIMLSRRTRLQIELRFASDCVFLSSSFLFLAACTFCKLGYLFETEI